MLHIKVFIINRVHSLFIRLKGHLLLKVIAYSAQFNVSAREKKE